MDIHRTEEEQIEAIKTWWKEQGNSVLATIAVAVIAVFGWQTWTNYTFEQKSTAGAQYQQLLDAMTPKSGPDLSTEERATANHLVEELKTNFAASSYAQYAAMLKAKMAVDDADLAAAKQELQWVLEQKPNAEIKAIALLRLARVHYALGEDDEALAIVQQDGGAFASAFAELKGDIYLRKDQVDKARDAYQQSVNIAKELGVQVGRIVEMKLQDLQEPADDLVIPAAESTAKDAVAVKEEKSAN